MPMSKTERNARRRLGRQRDKGMRQAAKHAERMEQEARDLWLQFDSILCTADPTPLDEGEAEDMAEQFADVAWHARKAQEGVDMYAQAVDKLKRGR